MNKKVLLFPLILFILFPSSAITLKFASPLPEGTEWHRALIRMATEWNDITNGEVRVRIYPGGIAGGQEDVIRKMRFGQLDMAVLTSPALATIVPNSFIMTMPFYLKSEEELDFVLQEIAPTFQEDFQEKGFTVLGWSKSGWVNFFSVEKVITPLDLRRMKLSVSPEELTMIEAFKVMGFNVIPLDWNNTLMGLQSGMVEAFYSTPLAAATYQWFALADNMLEMKIAPVLGGIIISQRTWNRIPQQFHAELKASVDRLTMDFYGKALELEAQAVEVMEENGLHIHSISIDILDQWKSIVGENYSFFVGPNRVVSRSAFDDYQARVEAFRAR